MRRKEDQPCKKNKCNSGSRKSRSLVVSILLLVSGILLILGNMGKIDKSIMSYIFSWQSLLIALGIVNLAGGVRSHWFASFILISIGTLFLVDDLYALETGTTNIIWPLLLIIIGVSIIVKIFIPRGRKNKNDDDRINYDEYSEDDYINISRVFSGVTLAVKSTNFQGGKMEFVFGGGEIDLREAKLAEGTSVLKVECVFGGVKLFVPMHWDVSIESSGVFGGFSDERRFILADEIDKTRKLIIKADAVFGGGEISN
ncbi:MAG: cell wall-active antibiotics response protein [Bacteroidales bacterium]|jgi:predicted membrane protein|nr:cell wall-active antibiotics response protein [Bacteroidales bacterium]